MTDRENKVKVLWFEENGDPQPKQVVDKVAPRETVSSPSKIESEENGPNIIACFEIEFQ